MEQDSDMPLVVAFEIMLNADPDDIPNLCQASRVFARICKNSYFWRAKYQRDFGDELPNFSAQCWMNAYHTRHHYNI